MYHDDLRLKELRIVLPNVMPPMVEDSCLSPMMDRAIVRGFDYGGSNISLNRWLRRAVHSGAHLCAICTGFAIR